MLESLLVVADGRFWNGRMLFNQVVVCNFGFLNVLFDTWYSVVCNKSSYFILSISTNMVVYISMKIWYVVNMGGPVLIIKYIFYSPFSFTLLLQFKKSSSANSI